jgi:hypothetical protein
MLLCHRITNTPMNSRNSFNSKNSIKDEVAEETFSKSSQEQAEVLMMNSLSASLPQQMTNVMIPQQHGQVLTMLNQQGTIISQQQQHPNLINGFIMNKNNNAASVLNTIGGWNAGYHTGASTRTSMEPIYTNIMRTIPPTSSRTDFDPSLLSLPKKRKHKAKELFPQKLMRVLSIEECQHAMRWMPDGCSFCIIDSQALVNFVLPKYFKEAKFSSFVSRSVHHLYFTFN